MNTPASQWLERVKRHLEEAQEPERTVLEDMYCLLERCDCDNCPHADKCPRYKPGGHDCDDEDEE